RGVIQQLGAGEKGGLRREALSHPEILTHRDLQGNQRVSQGSLTNILNINGENHCIIISAAFRGAVRLT
ncbi:hypothetical protein, partial [Amaricoccus sp.]|uniref:hypothetical protein n=1 Tax=Amaricoccus sp. TaxID=1872485 RepID=UPI001B6F4923